MTISKGATWGATVPRPLDLRVAVDDAQLAAWLTDGSGRPTAVASGDMWRTVGAASVAGRSELNELPIDLLEVHVDDAVVIAVAHVIVRRPWCRGGSLRGPVMALMNAEFIGDYDVAPRGHPNDGRVEELRVDGQMSIRQRYAVRSRLRNGSHLPHPQISTRSLKQAEYAPPGRLDVFVDGRRHRTSREFSIRVRPDAAVLYA